MEDLDRLLPGSLLLPNLSAFAFVPGHSLGIPDFYTRYTPQLLRPSLPIVP